MSIFHISVIVLISLRLTLQQLINQKYGLSIATNLKEQMFIVQTEMKELSALRPNFFYTQ